MGPDTKVHDRKLFTEGQVIFRQGDPGDRAYLIQTGQVAIIQEGPDGSRNTLATLSDGAIFGEMALIDNKPRAATAEALTGTTVFILSRDGFADRLKRSDPFVRALLNLSVRTIRTLNDQINELQQKAKRG